MADDARDLFNIEIDEFQKKAKVIISLSFTPKTWCAIIVAFTNQDLLLF